jgi:hypothetical protein
MVAVVTAMAVTALIGPAAWPSAALLLLITARTIVAALTLPVIAAVTLWVGAIIAFAPLGLVRAVIACLTVAALLLGLLALLLTRRSILAPLVALALLSAIFAWRAILIAAWGAFALVGAVIAFAPLTLLWTSFLLWLALVILLLTPLTDAIPIAAGRTSRRRVMRGRRHRLHRFWRQRSDLCVVEGGMLRRRLCAACDAIKHVINHVEAFSFAVDAVVAAHQGRQFVDQTALFRLARLFVGLQCPIGTERAQTADDSFVTGALLLFELQDFDKCFDRRWHSEFRLCFPCRTDAAEAQ